MNNITKSIVENLILVFEAAEDSLNEWTGEINLQFPVLLGMLAVKMNWDEKQVREADPFVRHYVRNHPDWYVTRGAHGGIMRIADKQKKESDKMAKALTKDKIKALIEARAATNLIAMDAAELPIVENELVE